MARAPWVGTTVATSLAFLLVTLAVSWHITIPIRDPEGTLLGKRIVLPFLFMGLFFGFDVLIRGYRTAKTEEASIMRSVVKTFLDRWWWRRIVLALVGFASFHLSYLCYRNLKSFVSVFNYQSYDPELLVLDRFMTGGHPPALLLHDLMPPDGWAHVLSTIYLAFIPWVPISVAAALTFSQRLRDGYIFVAASIWCWVLGTVSYYLIPSLGPFESAQWQFARLPETGVTQVQDSLVNQRLLLHADPIGWEGVASIGGFASLHVGIVFMAYLVMRYLGHKKLAWATMAALVPTVLATIYFGWHFIVDDIAGFFIGWASCRLAIWTVAPHVSWLRERAGGRPSEKFGRRADDHVEAVRARSHVTL